MMTRADRLKFCQICKNQKFDIHQGIVCGLTDRKADFEDNCEYFVEDTALKIKIEERQPSIRLASLKATQGQRLVNHLIDNTLSRILAVIILVTGIFIYSAITPNRTGITPLIFIVTIAILALFSYYILMEYYLGRTIAKFVTGTKVVTKTGGKPDFQTIVIRTLCRFIPFEPFSFIIDGEGSGWHDKISDTMVINVK